MTRTFLSAAAGKLRSFIFMSKPGSRRQINQAIRADITRPRCLDKSLFDKGAKSLFASGSPSSSQNERSYVDLPESEPKMLMQSTSGRNRSSWTWSYLSDDTIEPEKKQESVENKPRIRLPADSYKLWIEKIEIIRRFLKHRGGLESGHAEPKRIEATDRLVEQRRNEMYGLLCGAVLSVVCEKLIEFSEEHNLDAEVILRQFVKNIPLEGNLIGWAAPTRRIDNKVLQSLSRMANFIQTQACVRNEQVSEKHNGDTKILLTYIEARFDEFIKSYGLTSPADTKAVSREYDNLTQSTRTGSGNHRSEGHDQSGAPVRGNLGEYFGRRSENGGGGKSAGAGTSRWHFG